MDADRHITTILGMCYSILCRWLGCVYNDDLLADVLAWCAAVWYDPEWHFVSFAEHRNMVYDGKRMSAYWLVESTWSTANYNCKKAVPTAAGLLIPAVFLIAVGFLGCDRILIVFAIIISNSSSSLGMSGNGVNHLDLAPAYAGTLIGYNQYSSNSSRISRTRSCRSVDLPWVNSFSVAKVFLHNCCNLWVWYRHICGFRIWWTARLGCGATDCCRW